MLSGNVEGKQLLPTVVAIHEGEDRENYAELSQLRCWYDNYAELSQLRCWYDNIVSLVMV